MSSVAELQVRAPSRAANLPQAVKDSEINIKSQHLQRSTIDPASGFVFTGIFALNRSALNIALLGVPASLAFGFGSVFMICAVGVYV
ncbi:DNA repair protein Rad1 [Trichophyton rubrum]|uniref:Dolichyl-diphosphooligosaccharide-protein glycosyltransferase subunit OST5 n=1 Tax=Trichophyton rubrum TaxID=5551 RepID=A0A178F7J9_TRIRU|nr:DNA repair protein Rad1 [Trichophyton rubrum]